MRALQRLGAEHAVVVYGRDGMDEVSLGAATLVGELKDGVVREYEIHPEDFGLADGQPPCLARADARRLVGHASGVLDNQEGPAKQIVALNAGGACTQCGAQHGKGIAGQGRPDRPGHISFWCRRGQIACPGGIEKESPGRPSGTPMVRYSGTNRCRQTPGSGCGQKRIAILPAMRADAKPRAHARLPGCHPPARAGGQSAVIAEVKGQPSKGVLRQTFIPAILHKAMEGATACLSVLTDRQFFQGSMDAWKQARQLPAAGAAQDFLVDAYQSL